MQSIDRWPAVLHFEQKYWRWARFGTISLKTDKRNYLSITCLSASNPLGFEPPQKTLQLNYRSLFRIVPLDIRTAGHRTGEIPERAPTKYACSRSHPMTSKRIDHKFAPTSWRDQKTRQLSLLLELYVSMLPTPRTHLTGILFVQLLNFLVKILWHQFKKK